MFITMSALGALAGAGLIALAFKQRRAALCAWQWPTVSGTVRASSVVTHPAAAGGDGHPTYSADVAYDYQVNGHTYHGTCISDGMPHDLQKTYPTSLVSRYFAGSVAQVRHHPTDHAQAVLEIHPRGAGLATGTLGVLILAVGGVSAVLSILSSFLVTT